DDNHNSKRDPGERFTITNTCGNYSFTNLPPGIYTVAEELQAGWVQTAPATGTYEVTIQAVQFINGSFEIGPDTGPSFVRLSPGSTAITGWTVTSAAIDYVGPGWQASDGARSIDLDGNDGDSGGMAQTFATIPGVNYNVAFDM